MKEIGFAEEVYTGGFNWHAWKIVLGHARRYAGHAAGVIVSAVLMAATHVVFGLLVGAVINDPGNWRFYAGVNCLLVLVSVVGVFVFIRSAGWMASGLSRDLRRETFERLQGLSFSFFDSHPVGWLVARLTTDSDRLARIIAWGLLELTWGGVSVILTVVVMLVLSWKLAVVVLAVSPAVWFASLWFQRRLLATSRDIRRTNSRITSAFGECINGVKATRTLAREDENLREFGDLAGVMFQKSVLNGMLKASYLPVVLMLASLSIAATMVAGGWMVENRLYGMQIGTLATFILFARQIFRPVTELAQLLTEVQHACSAAERITGLLETRPEVEDRPGTSEGEDVIENVEFCDVRFSYDRREEVLHGINFKIHRGETVAIVGPTGAGKSTLVSLLCRFYEPTSGQIRINSADYTTRSIRWLQSRLGIVLQSPQLFSGTIMENIRYGRPSASDGDVIEAARLASADRFIRSLPGGYQATVGESGTGLSVGQQQLVTLARAVLADPGIFVMDEATASVDSVTERDIQKALDEITGDRISIVIAHRLSTVLAADRIIYLEGGKVIEFGTHEDLMAKKGRYRNLYLQQFSIRQVEQMLG